MAQPADRLKTALSRNPVAIAAIADAQSAWPAREKWAFLDYWLRFGVR
jgi:hypothetical protein